jgi:hypothetical protein
MLIANEHLYQFLLVLDVLLGFGNMPLGHLHHGFVAY